MRLASLVVLLATAALFADGPGAAAASDGKGAEKIESAVEVLKEISRIPEQGMPPLLLQRAHGVAVIPGMIKVGLIVGGRHGSGVLTVRQPDGTFGPPVFITLSGGSIGYQIGAQSIDVILVFKTPRSVENLMDGKFTLGADAAVAAGPVGRRAEASTDTQLKAEIFSYSRSRGLFAGVSLEGAAIQIDGAANETFYGEEVSARKIARGEVPKAPPSVRTLRDALAELSVRPKD